MHHEYWYNYDRGICCVLGGVLFCLPTSSDLNCTFPKMQVRIRVCNGIILFNDSLCMFDGINGVVGSRP